MNQDNKKEFCRHEVEEEMPTDGVVEADIIKLGFCPSCGTTIIVLGDHSRDIAFVHLPLDVLDQVIGDMRSIRQRLHN